MALGEFLDHFYTSSNAERLECLQEEPCLLEDERVNALVAAIAEHLAKSHILTGAPRWVEKPSRFIARPWFTSSASDPALQEYLTWSSPAAFKRRNIMTDGAPLRRASTPRASTSG
jgi:hypothetical protein